MKGIKLLIFFSAILFSGAVFAQTDAAGGRIPQESIIMFASAPNPAETKCQIRLYLPEGDPTAGIRILNMDSTLAKDISLIGISGINSEIIDVNDLKDGSYIYQLYYKGEMRSSKVMAVKH